MLKKSQRRTLAMAIVGLSSGLASSHAAAAPNAYVKVCNQTVASNPVSGSFTFSIDEVTPTSPVTPTRTVMVPVGGCSGGVMVDAGTQIRVREQPGVNIGVNAVTVTGVGTLVSTNPAKTTAIVLAPPLTTVVTFVNQKLLAVRVDATQQKLK